MEHILGVKETASKARLGMPEGSEVLGEDTTLADSNYDAFGNDEARHRYQRLFWEPYSENSVRHGCRYPLFLPVNLIPAGTHSTSGSGTRKRGRPAACVIARRTED